MKIKSIEHLSDTFDIPFDENNQFDAVGFGLNSMDHLCLVPEYPKLSFKTEIAQYSVSPGGQVATAMVFLARMGLKTKYIGKFGGDDFAQSSLNSIISESVDTTAVQMEKFARSQFSIIMIDQKNGERTVFCHRDKKLDFKDSELKEENICSGKILHLDGYDSASLKAANWCQARGIPVCMDLDTVVDDCQHLIKKVDFLIVSSNFPQEFTGIDDPMKAFKELRQCFDGFLAMTMGSGGALAWVGKQCAAFPGLRIKALDTTGAGDIFHGAFIYGLLQNWPLSKIMNFSNTAAGLSCGHLGAREGIYSRDEILHYTHLLIK